MTVKTAKQMMDAFYMAGRIQGMLPALPKGIIPSFIHILDALQSMDKAGEPVRASDLSEKLNIARPGITRALNEMERQDLIRRVPSERDRRVTELKMTEKGRNILETYSEEYFRDLVQELGQISEEDAAVTIQTIDTFYQVMLKRNRS